MQTHAIVLIDYNYGTPIWEYRVPKAYVEEQQAKKDGSSRSKTQSQIQMTPELPTFPHSSKAVGINDELQTGSSGIFSDLTEQDIMNLPPEFQKSSTQSKPECYNMSHDAEGVYGTSMEIDYDSVLKELDAQIPDEVIRDIMPILEQARMLEYYEKKKNKEVLDQAIAEAQTLIQQFEISPMSAVHHPSMALRGITIDKMLNSEPEQSIPKMYKEDIMDVTADFRRAQTLRESEITSPVSAVNHPLMEVQGVNVDKILNIKPEESIPEKKKDDIMDETPDFRRIALRALSEIEEQAVLLCAIEDVANSEVQEKIEDSESTEK